MPRCLLLHRYPPAFGARRCSCHTAGSHPRSTPVIRTRSSWPRRMRSATVHSRGIPIGRRCPSRACIAHCAGVNRTLRLRRRTAILQTLRTRQCDLANAATTTGSVLATCSEHNDGETQSPIPVRLTQLTEQLVGKLNGALLGLDPVIRALGGRGRYRNPANA